MTAVRVAALAGLAFTASTVDAGQAQPRREPATYTAEQADAGFAAYAQHCASCHGENLDDGPFAPPLRGTAFRETWLPRSVEALFTLTSTTMPEDRPGVLDDETVTDLVALMLQENGVEASGAALPADPDLLAGLAPGWSSAGGGLSPGAALPPWPVPYDPLDGMQPVTDDALHDPPAGDWLLWRRTYAAYGYSPLDQTPATSTICASPGPGRCRSGPTSRPPSCATGCSSCTATATGLQALDAADGDFLWEYQRRLPRGVSPSLKRGMSIYGDRLFVPTSDAHVVALDAKTGDVVWDREVGDLDAGLRMTGGTLVARGKVMVGTIGRGDGGNYIVALDAETGEEAWRFGTIPGPDEPGGHNLERDPARRAQRGLGLDPGQLRPRQQPGAVRNRKHLRHRAAAGRGRAARNQQRRPLSRCDARSEPGYRRAGVALPAPGERAVGPRLGLRAPDRRAAGRRRADERGRHDRQAGNLRFRRDRHGPLRFLAGPGAPDWHHRHRPGHRPQDAGPAADPRATGRPSGSAPHVGGGRSWAPTAYDPRTNIAYVPIIEACMDLVPVGEGERGSLTTGVRWTVRPRPESDGQYGRLEAVNLATGETAWIARQRAPQTTGALVTGGGLVFAGSLDRRISAYDAASGDRLWATRLSEVPNAPPITYAVDGRQYVAVIVGSGGYLTRAYSVLAPEIRNPPDRGAALWVFAQPERRAPGRGAP